MFLLLHSSRVHAGDAALALSGHVQGLDGSYPHVYRVLAMLVSAAFGSRPITTDAQLPRQPKTESDTFPCSSRRVKICLCMSMATLESEAASIRIRTISLSLRIHLVYDFNLPSHSAVPSAPPSTCRYWLPSVLGLKEHTKEKTGVRSAKECG